MINLSKRLASIRPSQTISLDTQAKALIAQGKSVINLSVGELDFEPVPAVLESAHSAIDSQRNHYSPPGGMPETLQAIQRYLDHYHKLHYEVEDIIVTNGAKQALFSAIQALVNSGDEILILVPGWVSYSEQIKLASGIPMAVSTTETFKMDIDAIKSAITAKTAGIIINYPNNPTGAVYEEDTLKKLADLCNEHDLWIISDEVYERLLYEQTSFTSFGHFAYDKTVIINGVSKSSAMTGWRLGFAAGPPDIIAGMRSLQGHLTGNVANIVQLAAQAALASAEASAELFLNDLIKRRQLILDWSIENDNISIVPPAGAFYCFIDIRQVSDDSEEFCKRLLTKFGVALVPGKYFGTDGYVRLSFANSLEKLEKAIVKIDECIASYM